MKILGYVLLSVVGLIAVALLTLLVMGRRPGADRMAVTVDIAKPPQTVWAYVEQPDKLKSWIGWLVDVRDETPGRHGVGSRIVLVMEDRNNGNRRMDVPSEVVAYEECKRETLRINVPGMFSGEGSYLLEDLGNGQSRLTQEGRYHFDSWFARLMTPLVMSAARKKMVEDMQRLKSVAEKS